MSKAMTSDDEAPATRFAKDQLKAFIERIERLESEKQAIADDIKDIYAEAKGNGFDVKAIRTIIKMRKQDKAEREEQAAIVDTYCHALGMLADTPLGDAAIDRVKKTQSKTREKADAAAIAHELADHGMISREAADETARISRAVAEKIGRSREPAHPS